jgi:hypothetical protein
MALPLLGNILARVMGGLMARAATQSAVKGMASNAPVKQTKQGTPGTPDAADPTSPLKMPLMFGGMALAVAGATKGLQMFAAHTMESAKKLAQFHPLIAQSVMKLERQQLLQNIQLGKATAGSTKTLGDAVMGMNESLQPLKQLTTNIKNVAATVGAKVVQGVATVGNLLLNPLNELVKIMTGAPTQTDTPIGRFLRGKDLGPGEEQRMTPEQRARVDAMGKQMLDNTLFGRLINALTPKTPQPNTPQPKKP